MITRSDRPKVDLPPVSVDLLNRLYEVIGQADRAARVFTVRLHAHDLVIDQLAAYMHADRRDAR